MLKRITRIIIDIAVVAVLALLLVVNISSVKGKTFLGYGLAVVLSGSMEPTLSVDDLVLVRETTEVSTGDVVVYKSEGGDMVIHRIVGIDGDTIVTQGDANNTTDTPFDRSCIVGKMIGHSRILGIGLIVVKKYYWLLVGLGGAYILAGALFGKDNDDHSQVEQRKV
jgi:signal peptidase